MDVISNETMWQSFRGRYSWAQNTDELVLEVIKMYPGMNSDDDVTRTVTSAFAQTHESFASSTNWEAKKHAEAGGAGKTFQYHFHHRQSFLWGYPEWVEGSHLDDMYSSLGEPFFEFYRERILQRNFSDVDTAIRIQIMNYYANFAYTGHPSQGPLPVDVEWTEFRSDDENFMLQQPIPFRMADWYEHNMVDKYRFWVNDFPAMAVPRSATKVQLFTEQDVSEAVDKVKRDLRQFITDDQVWQSVDNRINGFVAQRRQHVQA